MDTLFVADTDSASDGDGVSGDTAVTQILGQLALHRPGDTARLPLLSSNQLLHPGESDGMLWVLLKVSCREREGVVARDIGSVWCREGREVCTYVLDSLPVHCLGEGRTPVRGE